MFILFNVLLFSIAVSGKYLEGELKTNDVSFLHRIFIHTFICFSGANFQNWAFLARFCFLSDEGEYEYHIEYNGDQGDLNLLLYYDTEDQWNAVYKTNKVKKSSIQSMYE